MNGGDTVKGAILAKGEQYYTFLDEILPALEYEHLKYNWLLTGLECNCYPAQLQSERAYIWVSGKELSDIVLENKVQFIWGVLSAFEQNITLEEVLAYELPCADGYEGYWTNPPSLQHPKAEIEIIPWDSSLVFFLSRKDSIVDRFMRYFPLSEDLESYNTARLRKRGS